MKYVKRRQEVGGARIETIDDGHRYELRVRELGKENAAEACWPIAAGLRLPQPEDDPCNNPLLRHYLPLATTIEFKKEKH